MNYKDSSYYHSFRYSMFAILLALLFVGVISVTMITRVYKNNELKKLKNTGDLFISCLEDEYQVTGSFDNDRIKRLHFRFTTENKMKIYVYNKEGESILSSADYDGNKYVNDNIDRMRVDNSEEEVPDISSSIKEAIDGKKHNYLALDSASFSKNQPCFLYGARAFLSKNGEIAPDKVYIVFGKKTDDMNSFMLKSALIYIAFALVALYLSFIILRKKVRKQAAYEFDFLKVCEMYAKGDFSEKIRDDADGIPKEIAGYVNALASDVENSEQTSKTFIANVSHELRTPMTTISGFVSGILDGTIPKSRQNEYLVLVSNEMQRLRILISSMLNMTRYESGTLTPNFKETNLTDLVVKTVLMFEKKIDDKRLEVEGLDSDRLVAVVDPDLMQQVIYNIVENAVKFVNEGGTLSFSFEKVGGINTVAIRNTGEGLTEEEIQQVFDRFYKTDSSRGKDAAGLGIGLSISRKIVHLHKGHIVVKSIYGEYTEFQIQIPELSEKKRLPERKNPEKNEPEKKEPEAKDQLQ